LLYRWISMVVLTQSLKPCRKFCPRTAAAVEGRPDATKKRAASQDAAL
jgi:hypothetical protein